MIHTGYSGSNYINSLSSFYRYDYSKTAGRYSGFNTATLSYGKTNYVNTEAIQYLQSVKDGAKGLSEAMSALTTASTFNKMTAASSSTDYLSVDSKSSPTSVFESTSINIRQVAAGQTNTGAALKATDSFGAYTGRQQLEIEIDGKKHQVSIEVKAGDTNKAVQQKMADAINGKSLGITASVSQDASGKSTLSVRSNNTGADSKNSFSIRDMSGSLVAKTGIANVSQAAQDAVYSINGGPEQASKSNSVDLGNGVKATLRKATEEPVTLSVQNSKAGGVDALTNMADSFNSLLKAAKENGNSGKLYKDLTNAYRTYAGSLRSLGVSANSDGTLKVDKDKAMTAAEDGSLERFFTQNANASYGFAHQMSKVASTAKNNPSYYVSDARSTQNSLNTLNTDSLLSDLFNTQSYGFNTYTRTMNLGFLFDMFV